VAHFVCFLVAINIVIRMHEVDTGMINKRANQWYLLVGSTGDQGKVYIFDLLYHTLTLSS